MEQSKYIVSPVTDWDNEKELFATYLGVDGRNMPLHYTCWGKTEAESRTRAERLGAILAKEDLAGVTHP